MDREAEGAAQAVAKSGPAEGSAKAGPEAPSRWIAKADRSFWRRRCASGGQCLRWKQRESACDKPGINWNLYPARPCCCPRQSQGGPPRTGGGSSFGSGGHGPGDRRKARMPLPARVAHAAETRRDDPSGSERRSPVTRGLAAMPAPFCCPAYSPCRVRHSPSRARIPRNREPAGAPRPGRLPLSPRPRGPLIPSAGHPAQTTPVLRFARFRPSRGGAVGGVGQRRSAAAEQGRRSNPKGQAQARCQVSVTSALRRRETGQVALAPAANSAN